MKLYRTHHGNILEVNKRSYLIDIGWDELINREDLYGFLTVLLEHDNRKLESGTHLTGGYTGKVPYRGLSVGEAADWIGQDILAPIGSQEVWAAGVTYLRSRDARMEESKGSGGADFYDKVYMAERPELFFKSLAHRVAAHGELVYIRRDSSWNVPEPELTLFINAMGQIQAYTIGNDMSSRSIEGENPLYLPQAKTYERSAALGPCLYIPQEPIDPGTGIHMTILRGGEPVYTGTVAISQMKRSLPELVSFLYRETDFASGCFLMTGTCLVPPNDFTLAEYDIVEIGIDGIGTLVNTVAYKPQSLSLRPI